ncbi:MAG: hypothetical protein J6Y02_08900 [Pseudobutyrivibrio sp.]|nr:hypothetical protein [Pseudobutyrivibrio sp.]
MEINKEKLEELKEILKKYNKPAILGVLPCAMMFENIRRCKGSKKLSNNRLRRLHKPMLRRNRGLINYI